MNTYKRAISNMAMMGSRSVMPPIAHLVEHILKLKPRRQFSMVHHIHLSWNALEPSLVLMHEKLSDLGWVYYSGEVHIIEPRTERSDFHETSYD